MLVGDYIHGPGGSRPLSLQKIENGFLVVAVGGRQHFAANAEDAAALAVRLLDAPKTTDKVAEATKRAYKLASELTNEEMAAIHAVIRDFPRVAAVAQEIGSVLREDALAKGVELP